MKYSLLLIMLAFCTNQETPRLYENWEGKFIEEVGIYTFDSYSLSVLVEEETLRFELRSESDQTLVQSNSSPSIYHRWFLYVDDDNNIWFYSGDTGIDLYINMIDMYEYRYVDFFDDEEMKKIPEEFKNKLDGE